MVAQIYNLIQYCGLTKPVGLHITSFSTWVVLTERENKCSFEPPTHQSCGFLTTKQTSKFGQESSSPPLKYTIKSFNYVNPVYMDIYRLTRHSLYIHTREHM